MVDYIYSSLPTVNPDLKAFVESVKNSDMSDKGIQTLHYEKENTQLKVVFGTDLSTGDKTKLDNLVSEMTPVKHELDRVSILGQILSNAVDQAQVDRLLDGLNSYPAFAFCLDNFNYPLAMTQVQKALDDEIITQDDYDLINSYIPS